MVHSIKLVKCLDCVELIDNHLLFLVLQELLVLVFILLLNWIDVFTYLTVVFQGDFSVFFVQRGGALGYLHVF